MLLTLEVCVCLCKETLKVIYSIFTQYLNLWWGSQWRQLWRKAHWGEQEEEILTGTRPNREHILFCVTPDSVIINHPTSTNVSYVKKPWIWKEFEDNLFYTVLNKRTAVNWVRRCSVLFHFFPLKLLIFLPRSLIMEAAEGRPGSRLRSQVRVAHVCKRLQ